MIETMGVLLKRAVNWLALRAVDATIMARLGCRGSSYVRQFRRKLTFRDCLRVLLMTTVLHVPSRWLC